MFTPPNYEVASPEDNPHHPYNIALLGDVVTSANAEFSVEVTFRGQMAGIVVFGSENSYVMCRLDSATNEQATGISIVKFPNDVVVNGKQYNGQRPNPENTPIRLKITIHEGVVTCYSNGLGESSEVLPRVTGAYTDTHTGRFGFVTLNAAASFRILGCPSNTPNPPLPPCIPDSESDADDKEVDTDSDSIDQDSIDTESDDGSDGFNLELDDGSDDGGSE